MNNQPQQTQQPRVYKTSEAQRRASKKYNDRLKQEDIQAYRERQAEYREKRVINKAEWEADAILQQQYEDFCETGRRPDSYYLDNGYVRTRDCR